MTSSPQHVALRQAKIAENRLAKGRPSGDDTPPLSLAGRQQHVPDHRGRSSQLSDSASGRRNRKNERKSVQRVVLVDPKDKDGSYRREDGGSSPGPRPWVMRRLSAKRGSSEMLGLHAGTDVCSACGHRSASPILERGRVSPDVGWLTVNKVEGKKSARLMARMGDITSRMSMALNTFETAFDFVDDEDSLDDFRARVDSIDDGEVRVEMKTFIERYREMMAHVEEVNEEREQILMSLSDWFGADHLFDMGTEWDKLEASLQEAEESGSQFREGMVTAKVASEKLKNMNEQMKKLKDQGRKTDHLTVEKENLQKQVINAFKQVKQKPIEANGGAVLKHAAKEVNDLLKRIRTEGKDAIAILEAELQKLLTRLQEQTVNMNMLAAEVEEKKMMYHQVMEENTKLTNEKLLMQERMERTLDEVVRLKKALKAQGQVEESSGMKVNVKEGKWLDEDGKWYDPTILLVQLKGLRVKGTESEREIRRLKVQLGEVKSALEKKEIENDALLIQLKSRPKVVKSSVRVEHTTTTVRSETTELVQSPQGSAEGTSCRQCGQASTAASAARKVQQDSSYGQTPAQSTPEAEQNAKVVAKLTQENEVFRQSLKTTQDSLDMALQEIERLKTELAETKQRQAQDQYMFMPADMDESLSEEEEMEIMHQDFTRDDTQSIQTIQDTEQGSTLPTKSPHHPESLLSGGDASPCPPPPPSPLDREDGGREKEVVVTLIQPESHLAAPTRSAALMKRLSHIPAEQHAPSHENLMVEEFIVKHKAVQCDLQQSVPQIGRSTLWSVPASRHSIRTQGGLESEQLLHTVSEQNKWLSSSDGFSRAARKFLKSEIAAAMLDGEEPAVVEWETTAALKKLQRKLDEIAEYILEGTREAMSFVSQEGGAMLAANTKIRGKMSDTSLAGVQNEDEDTLLKKYPALVGGARFRHRSSQAGKSCLHEQTEEGPEEDQAVLSGGAMKERLKSMGQHAADMFGTMMNLAHATVKQQFQDYVALHQVMLPKHRQQMKELKNLLEGVEDSEDDDDDFMYKGSRRRSSILHKYFLDNRMEQKLRKTMQVKGLRTLASGFQLSTPPRPATDSQQEPRLVLSKSFIQLHSTVSHVDNTPTRPELEIPKATAPKAGLPVLVVGLGNRTGAQTTYPRPRRDSIAPWRDGHLYKMTALDPRYRLGRTGAKPAGTTKLGSGFALTNKKEPEPKPMSRSIRTTKAESRQAGLTFPLPTLKPTRLHGKGLKGTTTRKIPQSREQRTVLPVIFVTNKQK